MRYEDASQGTSNDVSARDDTEHLAGNDFGPATGNIITGAGTVSGSAGADMAAGAHITAIAGAGGSDTSFDASGNLEIAGQYGTLTIDAQGDYTYVRNAGSPEGVTDSFTYTLADAAGATADAKLVIAIGNPPILQAQGSQTIQTANGVVVLPAGVELSDVHVQGRNLVITLPDGSTMVIPDGAIFVPQLVVDGVEVPASNLAALLIGSEPKPAAGDSGPNQLSSGGNFEVPVAPLDPGVPLGDLIPPTELTYTPPEVRDIFPDETDEDPIIQIQPDGQPATVAAVDEVEEAGLPTRNGGEPAGSDEIADGNGSNNSVTSETTAGTIIYNSPDGVDSITLNGIEITSVGQVIGGAFGFGSITITSIAPGAIGYSYTLADNTSGNDTHDDFLVVLTDTDGDQAAATLVIDIIDDVPTARPDTDTVGVGGFLASGNVITDAALGDAGDTDTNAADTVGADDAVVTFIDSVNAAPGASVPNGGFTDIAGQYGTLRIFSNGDYLYTRSPESGGGKQDVFNYTLTDGDGDTSVTTLTIDIPNTPIAVPFSIGNVLDDDAQPGGNPDGPEDDGGGSFLEGDVNANGGDGGLTYSLRATGAPEGFTYELAPNGDLLIKQDGNLVVTVTLNSTTGHWTITQNAPIDHPTLNGEIGDDTENNLDFNITVRATDADGDFVEGTGLLTIDDDTPTIIASGAEPQLVVDETTLGTNASASFAGAFITSVGADTPGSTAYALHVAPGGVASGLFDVATGNQIYLYDVGGTIVGKVGSGIATPNASGATSFVVTVDSNGLVTLDQQLAIQHSPDSGPDQSISMANDSLISLSLTVTDADGDSVSSSVNIASNLTFKDDAPHLGTSSGTEPTITVDETTLATNASASFAGFLGAVGAGYGADGAGTSVYALHVAPGGVASGLFDVATGNQIYLYDVGGTIVGKVGSGPATADSNGATSFVVTVDSNGLVTLDQQLAMQHPNASNPDDPLSMANDSLISLSLTVTDKDGDSVSSSVDIASNLTFKDDGPHVEVSTLAEPILTVDETDLPTAIGPISFIDDFSFGFGADGAAASNSKAFTLSITSGPSGLVDTITGNQVFLFLESGQVVGREGTSLGDAAGGEVVFTVSVNADGEVTLDQERAVVHGDPTDPDEADTPALLSADDLIKLNMIVTDKDGDQASASINIARNLHFEDDGPSATNEAQQDVNEGATKTGTFDFLTGNDGGSVTHINGTALVFDGVTHWSQWIAVDDGQIRTMADGHYEFQANNNASGVTSGTFTVTDGDGDPATANWAFNILDVGTPTAGASTALADDDGLAGAAAGGTNDIDANAGEVAVANPSEAIFHGDLNADFGSDGAGTISFAEMVGQFRMVGTERVHFTWDAATLTLKAIVDATSDGVTAQARAGTELFKVVLDPSLNGNYTLTLENNVLHAAGGNDETSAPNVALGFHIVDSDNSPAGGAAGTLNITFNDDMPTLGVSTGSEPTLTVDDTTLATNASASFAGVLGGLGASYGADGAGSTVYALHVAPGGVASGLFDVATGNQIYLYDVGGTIVGKVGSGVATPNASGATSFTVTVDSNGLVTLDQVLAIQHTPDSGPDQPVSMANDSLISLSLTITDADGDAVSSSVNIASNLTFKDDAPHLGTPSGSEPTLTVDDTTLATNASASFAGFLGAAGSGYGADGAGTTVYALHVAPGGVASGLFDVATGNQIYLYDVGGTIVGKVGSGIATPNASGATSFTVTVDSNGLVTLDQVLAIQHSPDSGPDQSVSMANDSLISLSLTITDKDGDAVSSSVNIASNLTFKDDAPTIYEPQNATLTNAPGAAVFFDLDDPLQGGDDNILNNFGADGPGTVRISSTLDNTDSGFTSGGVKIWYILDATGTTLLGKTGTTAALAEASGTTIFTVAIDTANSRYSVDMDGAIDNGSGVTFENFNGAKAGNTNYVGIGADTAAGPAVDLVLSGSLGTNADTSINTDSDSIGAANQSMDVGETVRIDFVSNLTSGAATPTGFNYSGHISSSQFLGFIPQVQGSQAETVAFTVYALNTTMTSAGTPDRSPSNGFSDSTVRTVTSVTVQDYLTSGTTTVDITGFTVGSFTNVAYGISVRPNADGSVTFSGIQEGDHYGITTSGTSFNAIAVQSNAAGTGGSTEDSFDLGVFSLGQTNLGSPLNISLPTEIVDRDGDVVSGGDIDITLNPIAPPVVLDLNGDGVHFVSQDAGVTYNYGAGLVATAWAGADDGILVRDANGNGTVDNASEFVFGGNGVTDMEALHAQYGEQLDASDADFTQFAVWNDANSNGVVDANELHSLAEAGITSIGLVSDGNAYSAADGDVQVAGTAQYTRADGSTGDAADAIFSTGAAKSAQELERIAANSNNVALAAAVGAAGIAANPAAASAPSFDGDTSQPVASVQGDAPAAFAAAGDENYSSALIADHASSIDSGAQAMASTSHTAIMASEVGQLTVVSPVYDAPTELLDATDAAAANVPMPSTGMDVSLPSLQPLVATTEGAATASADAHEAGSVAQIIADALHGGDNGTDINALLNALPGTETGGKDGLQDLTIPITGDVPTWDTAEAGVFTMDVAHLMTNAPMVLHHDAVQPVANG